MLWQVRPEAAYVGQTVTVTLALHMPEGWADASLVQLFQQELALPVQIEAFSLAPDGLVWLDAQRDPAPPKEPAGSPAAVRTTLVLDGEIAEASSDAVILGNPILQGPILQGAVQGAQASPSTHVVTVERLARLTRPGSARLEAPVVRYTSAASFKDDFIRGRTPVDPKRQEARGQRLEIQVQRLPEAGRPLGFDGAVGAFELRASGPTRAVEVDAPFDLLVEVSGPSPLPDRVRPRLVGMDSFTKLGIERLESKRGSQGGPTTFRISLAGRSLEAHTSPSLEFDTFDPIQGKYVLASSAPVPLALKAKGSAQSAGKTPGAAPAGGAGVTSVADLEGSPAGSPPAPSGDGAPNLTWTLSVLGLVGVLAFVSAIRRISHRSKVRTASDARPHVLMIGKYPLEAAAGDVVSVRRLGDYLRSAGFRMSYSPVTPDGEFGAPPMSIPSVVHALNAEAPATLGAKFAKEWGVPLVVTTTGTDINRGLMELDRRGAVLANLKAADRVLVLTAAQGLAVKQAVPGAPVEQITQGVLLEPSDFALREFAGIPAGRPVALMLGGLRQVKGQRMALEAWAEDFGWHLVIAGDSVDATYAEGIREAAGALAHVTVLGALPHRDAIAALRSADALLNTSDSEGESRAILEAMALGIPVAARKNTGNAALIEHGVTGLLFDGADEIKAALKGLAPGTPQAARIREAAMNSARGRGASERDEDALIRIYRDLMGDTHAAEDAELPHPHPTPVGN